MKRICTLLMFATLCLCSMAQVPQGINYQAVLYSASGLPLSNHAVGVRLSILNGSALGPVLYAEEKHVITDTLGLLEVVIGSGTAVTGTFSGIDWAHGSKWLKTEVDTTGGTTYLIIGASQFMSVPYALYAAQSSQSSPSLDYPDGMDSVSPVFLAPGFSYTVPTGKNLYVSNFFDSLATVNLGYGELVVDADTLNAGDIAGYPVAFSAGAHLSSPTMAMTGFLVSKKVTWVEADITGSTYTVPAGKMLYIKNTIGGYTSSHFPNNYNYLSINGVSMNLPFKLSGTAPLILDENQTILYSSSAGHNGNYIRILGYLRDK